MVDESWPARAVAEQALLRIDKQLAASPDDLQARFERARLLDQLGRSDAARQAYLEVLARDMAHEGALRHLAALLIAQGFTTAALTVLTQAAAALPDNDAVQVSLGHLLREAGDLDAARRHYEAALRIDPAGAEAHQGMSYLLDGIDENAAALHRTLGFATRVLTTSAFRGQGWPVTVLRLVSARGGNVPTRLLLDDTVFLTHTLVAEFTDSGTSLPPLDLVFNAIGDAERCGEALDRSERLLAGLDLPVINAPARIRQTTRAGNAVQLGVLEGVTTPLLATVPRGDLSNGPPAGFSYPFLIRSPGFHTGQHFKRIGGAADLEGALDTLPGADLSAIQMLNAQGADGAWRKYRVMIVGGQLLPLHLAIAPQWKVHHFTAGMSDRPADRVEEAAFLDDMPGTLGPAALAALRRVAETLGLDYGGIDFALDSQGGILLFEANATMTVALPVPGSVWSYRHQAVSAVLQATHGLLLGKARVQGAGV